MIDTTIIYYTCNELREPFFSNAQRNLLAVKENLPLISVSQKPLDFGENILFDGKRSIHNIYRQLYIGAKEAKTKYIATAEDDVLYSKEHFQFKVPEDNVFWYDIARLSLHTWSPGMFSLNQRRSLAMMICSRDLLIEAMEERLAKYIDDSQPCGEFGRFERRMGVSERVAKTWSANIPSIIFYHPDSLGYKYRGPKKTPAQIQAYDIPYWGKAVDVVNKFYFGK